jgi:hypothetical protein
MQNAGSRCKGKLEKREIEERQEIASNSFSMSFPAVYRKTYLILDISGKTNVTCTNTLCRVL